MDAVVTPGGIFHILNALISPFKATTINATGISAQLKASMCQFQLEYTKFQFIASQYHKKFKEAERKGDTPKTKEAYDELTMFVDTGIKLSCQLLGELLQEYFCQSRLAHDRPRIGIHAVDKDENISPLFITDHHAEFSSKKMSDFTPFKEIMAEGTPYLENNIPRLICSRKDYEHAGLNLDRIRKEYKYGFLSFNKDGISHAWLNSKPISRFNRIGRNHRDVEWNDTAPAGKKNGSTIYKSHLIVPITFRGHGNKIPNELVKVLKLREDGRSILGFIAIDHPTTHYFDGAPESDSKNIDVNVAFIIADMLSLVRITEFMYTSGSSSYRKFEELKENGE